MSNSHIFKIAARVVRAHLGKTLLMILAIIGSILAALVPPLVLERAVDSLSSQTEIVLSIAFGYLIVFAISGFFESLQNIMITSVGQAITHEMRTEMSQKLGRLPAGYFTKNETGKITSRFVNDVDAVDSLFTNGIISMFADAFKVISVLIVIFTKSRGLGYILCVVTPLIFLMTVVFKRRMKKAQLENRGAVAKVNHHVPETIENIRMIRNTGAERFMEEKYDKYIAEGYAAMDKSNFYDSIYSPIVILVSAIIIAVMMTCASFGDSMQALFGMSVGNAVAIIAYVTRFFDPLQGLGMEIQNIQSALAGVTRIDEFLSETEVPEQKEGTLDSANSDMVTFLHVKFSYDGDRDVLNDLSFNISSGEHVVFMGRTGAGKSTIFKLILGLYAPTDGSVKVSGVNATDIKEHDRRKLFGYVEQNFAVLEGSIRDQITLLDSEITDGDVFEALELCGLREKIDAMPGGIEAPMNSSDFSQGELQLMSIARALVAKPQIMLLDEITANLDSVTEKKILEVVSNASVGRTVISISHRMSEGLLNLRVITIE